MRPFVFADVFQSQKIELNKFVFAARVSLCLFILIVDVLSRLLIWFARVSFRGCVASFMLVRNFVGDMLLG